MSLFYLLPPSGTPVSLGEIVRAWARRAGSSGENGRFQKRLLTFTGARYVATVANGRTAQYLLLKAMAELSGPGKSEVIIPAYTCFSVAASAARAGLRIRLVDIVPTTMDYRYDMLEQTDCSSVLALSACNLFGLVSNWERLSACGKARQIFLIDDAAQTLGSRAHGRMSGTLGDAGFYSLDRGKNLSTYAGGVMITSDDRLAKQLERDVRRLAVPGSGAELATLVKLMLYGLFLHPRCFWLPNMLPFLGLGETVYEPEFSTGRLSPLQESLAELLFERLTSLNETRRANARSLAQGIIPLGRFEIPGYSETRCPVFLRLPLLASDRATRDRMVARLRRHGIVASTMYPSTIADIPGIRGQLANPDESFAGAQRVVDTLFTLPTHPYLRDKDIARIVSCLKEG